MTALNTYTGAVILITHDSHLIELVADRLWLVKDGRVTPFEDDLAAYRKRLLAKDTPKGRGTGQPSHRKTQRREAAAAVQALAPLKAEVKACEERLATIEAMLTKIDRRLADPSLYDGPSERIESLQIKRGEILDAQARAEALWLAAEEALEAAKAAS